MAVKYHCPKCERRFVEWGAQKLGFKCPNCEGEELVRVGAASETPQSTASLKRRPKKIDTRTALYDDDVDASTFGDGFEEDIDEEVTEADVEPEIAVGVGAAAGVDVAGDVELEADLEDAEDVVDDEIPGVLDFEAEAGVVPPDADEDFEEEL
jgi:DNA-directed RNA polymerase subunit RPC12/RpoP